MPDNFSLDVNGDPLGRKGLKGDPQSILKRKKNFIL